MPVATDTIVLKAMIGGDYVYTYEDLTTALIGRLIDQWHQTEAMDIQHTTRADSVIQRMLDGMV
jgi:hypothetical protein